MILNNINQLIEELKSGRYKIIGIHGAPFAGKSTLAKSLNEVFGGALVQIDNFVSMQPKGRYPDYIDIDKLSQAILSQKESSPIIFIEGICLLEILKKISIKPETTIYVKNQYVTDKLNYDIDDEALEEKLKDIASILRFVPNSDGECLDKDNAIYHNRYKPVQNSSFVYIWESSDFPEKTKPFIFSQKMG